MSAFGNEEYGQLEMADLYGAKGELNASEGINVQLKAKLPAGIRKFSPIRR
jgi:hypothetical protein